MWSMPRNRKKRPRKAVRAGGAVLAGVVGLAVLAAPAPAAADEGAEQLPVAYNSIESYAAGFGSPTVPPPGANDWSCEPSTAHPSPVVLVHGTLANMNNSWRGASPLLKNNGYCVFALNYGGATPDDSVQGVGAVEKSAEQLGEFIGKVLAATGADEVDVVGHSQGGMMPRYYLKNLDGADKVGKLIGLAPSNHGTDLSGIVTLGETLGLLDSVNDELIKSCESCVQQEVGSDFITRLNAGGDTVPGVDYTVIQTNGDQVVTPYESAFLEGPGVENILVNEQCALDLTEHLEIAYDPIALTDVLNALDPAHPRPITCQLVLPYTGPVAPPQL